jgi:DNA (cytosine-5)-methyltransferase 1
VSRMKYVSVCSGIEAATVAWHHLGWEPAWFSEIEPFPCSALKHHYPNVPNLGDMTKWSEWPDDTIDVLVGGTPCQSFSVAGKRAGMDDPRGQLALAFSAIARRYKPRWIVWENVPGVLSSGGGRDFGAFIGALAELGYGCAYRVLDAQHFGVAQRRRRVFVVGHLGDWRCAAAVLFERESLCRDIAKGGKAREEVAERSVVGAVTSSLSNGLGHNKDEMVFATKPIATLTARFAKGLGYDGQDINAGLPHLLLSPTVTSKWAKGSGGPSGDECQNLVAFPANLSATQHAKTEGLAPSMGAKNPTAIAIRTANTGANGHGVADEKSHTLDGANGQAVCSGSSMQVRRLTPIECERLQGFPDNYTNVPHRGKPAADGPRYKSLGNSMAVPVMRWIGERIEMVESIMESEGGEMWNP